MLRSSWMWLKFNPWMKDIPAFDDRIGIIINPIVKLNQQKVPVGCIVLWSDGKINKNFQRNKLKVLDENR